MATRVFKKPRNTYNLYSTDEKLQLAELVAKRKEEYDAEVARGKTRYDAKRKKHVALLREQFGSFILTFRKRKMTIPNFVKR